MRKRIVVLGGGIGGLVATNTLRLLLRDEHNVILVEKNCFHAFPASFLWVMVGCRKREDIVRPVKSLLEKGVKFVQTSVSRIDTKNKTVSTYSGAISYDFLVVALGAEYSWQGVPGLHDGVHTFYTLDGVIRLHAALSRFEGGRIALAVCGTPYRCPAAPFEAMMLLDHFFRERGLRKNIELHIFTPESAPMAVTGTGIGDAVQKMLDDRGVFFHPLHKLASINGKINEISFHQKSAFSYDVLICVPGLHAPDVARDAGLVDESGWIPVDRNTLQTTFEDIYAVGDITSVLLPGRWKPEFPLMLPKAGAFAHAQAEVVAKIVAGKVNGTTVSEKFKGYGY